MCIFIIKGYEVLLSTDLFGAPQYVKIRIGAKELILNLKPQKLYCNVFGNFYQRYSLSVSKTRFFTINYLYIKMDIRRYEYNKITV